jgi:transglutaminase-like putative cysteine protease
VVGTVLFSPGEPIAASVQSFEVEVPASGFEVIPVRIRGGGEGLAQEEILTTIVKQELGQEFVGLTASREEDRGLVHIGVMRTEGQSLPDSLVARPPSRLGEGRSYTISGFVPIVPPEELRTTGDDDPAWVRSQYLQLPEDLPTRISALAADITRDGSNRYDKAVLLQEYLRQFPIDFDIAETPPGRDTIDYFLFDSQRGYFDYHASAMAVMLRTLGIPSRLAVGFVIDEADKNLESGSYSIRDRNSYAWTEVYFAGHGWIAFNSSPDRPEDLNPIIEATAEPDDPLTLEDFPGLPVTADPIFDIPVQQGGDAPSVPIAQGRDYNPLLTLGVAAFLALLGGSVFLGWQRSVAGLPYSQQLWEKTVRLATWAGQGPRTGQTPSEFARSLKRNVRDSQEVSVLVVAYNRSRFGRQEDEEERAALSELWPQLRNALLGAMVQRLTRRGRTRSDDGD